MSRVTWRRKAQLDCNEAFQRPNAFFYTALEIHVTAARTNYEQVIIIHNPFHAATSHPSVSVHLQPDFILLLEPCIQCLLQPSFVVAGPAFAVISRRHDYPTMEGGGILGKATLPLPGGPCALAKISTDYLAKAQQPSPN